MYVRQKELEIANWTCVYTASLSSASSSQFWWWPCCPSPLALPVIVIGSLVTLQSYHIEAHRAEINIHMLYKYMKYILRPQQSLTRVSISRKSREEITHIFLSRAVELYFHFSFSSRFSRLLRQKSLSTLDLWDSGLCFFFFCEKSFIF